MESIGQDRNLAEVWQKLPLEQRTEFNEAAKTAELRRAEAVDGGVQTVLGLNLPRQQQSALLRKVGKRLLRNLLGHPSWQRGASVGCYNSPLRVC